MNKNSTTNADNSDITVAAYYFGQFHPNDPRNLKLLGKEWSEWELIKDSRPRFPGHQQPKVPLWGYEDESDPKVMAKKIDAAADHGIDAFIFDWYHYDDGPFLERPINDGFLKAENNDRIKFALMWANHDWQRNLFPFKKGDLWDTIYPGKVSPDCFETICDHIIKDYFLHPSYWKIDGKPYFSFFELSKLLSNFGSVEATRAALDTFRQKARDAGLPGIHLNIVAGGEQTILPGDDKSLDTNKLISELGFDSATSYVWVNHVPLPDQETDYNQVRDDYFKYWEKISSELAMPYLPNVLMGWDVSPRCDQSTTLDNSGYPYMNVIVNNTPDNFETTLRLTKERLLADPKGPRAFTINCWNEWTEGSYLEPDTVSGYGYLEAVKRTFVSHSKKT